MVLPKSGTPSPEYALNGISKSWANKIFRTVSLWLLDSQVSSMRGKIISVYCLINDTSN